MSENTGFARLLEDPKVQEQLNAGDEDATFGVLQSIPNLSSGTLQDVLVDAGLKRRVLAGDKKAVALQNVAIKLRTILEKNEHRSDVVRADSVLRALFRDGAPAN